MQNFATNENIVCTMKMYIHGRKKSHHYINYIFINVGLFIYGLQPQLNFEITTFARWLQFGLACCKYFSSKG